MATITNDQRSELELAANRKPGESWSGSVKEAERCCDLGLLEAVHIDPSWPERGVVYQLTESGRSALDAS